MRPLRMMLLASLAALVAPVMAQQKLTLERVFASPDLAGTQPRELKLSPDGRLVTLLRNRPEDRQRYDLWAIDTRSGAERMLVDSLKVGSGAELSEAEKMQRERARIGDQLGIVAYDWAPDGQSILVPLDGDLYLARLDGSVSRLTNSPQGELNAVVSPRGRFVSFVREGELFALTLATGAERQLTTGASATVSWGVAEFVAQEEMHRHTGHWWAPDDSLLAVARVDESPVGVVTRTVIGGEGSRTYQQRYPAAGTANALVDLYVFKPDGSPPVKVDLGADPDVYLARVDWSHDARTLYVQRQSRDQKRLDLLAVDPATGRSRVVLTETATTWINLSDNFHPLRDGSLLWWSERSGHGHLYRIHGDTWSALTSGEWQVDKVVAVDEAKGLVYFTGNRETPIEQQLYVAPLRQPGPPRQLTASGWWHEAVMDKQATRAVITRQNSDQPRQVYLADARGERLRWLSDNALTGAHPYAPYVASHVKTTFGTIQAADGATLYTKLMTPPLQPGKRYPVFMIHYGGPGAGRQVVNQWSGALHQYLVDQGWIVFAVDNRGTPARGKAFEDHLYRAMGTVEVEDQLRGVEWLRAQPFVDPARIMTYGWSYGGYLSLKLAQKAPGTFAAIVSGAPVTRWELYDTHYTERYLGQPQDEPSAYPAADALDEAAQIKDPLLLIHGMSDDNVVFDNTTALLARMQAAAVPFQMMAYPGQTHRVAGPLISVHLWRTIGDFLARYGGPAVQ